MREKKRVDQEQVFDRLPVPSALRVMIVPAVVSQLIVLIYNMADTFYVGQTDKPLHGGGHVPDPSHIQHSLCLAGLPEWAAGP